MKELRAVGDPDLQPLQMENELLKYEVRHLRARLASADRVRKDEVDVEKRRRIDTEKRVKEVRERLQQKLEQANTRRTALREKLDTEIALRTRARKMLNKSDADRAALRRRLDETAAELVQARDDLRWLLDRLDRSVVGPLLRRRAGFRTLLERYRPADPS